MHRKKLCIYEAIIKLRKNDLSRHELNYLIEKSYQISSAFLKSKYGSKLSITQKNIDDIAMDAIVPLFTVKSNGNIGILNSLLKWNNEIEMESDADFFLSSIIWRRVEQTVSKELKENDPIFAKILKTLNTCIKNNELKKIRYFGTVLVVKKKFEDLDRKIIDEINFNLIPKEIFGLKQLTLFEKLFEYLENETEFHDAIPLNLLVKRIKRFYSSSYEYNSKNYNTEDQFYLVEIVRDALNDVKEKIEVYYLKNNKLTESDAESIYNALGSISKDLLNGGINDSLYAYLRDFQPTLTKEEFYKSYHPIMNYLLKRLKNNIFDNLYY